MVSGKPSWTRNGDIRWGEGQCHFWDRWNSDLLEILEQIGKLLLASRDGWAISSGTLFKSLTMSSLLSVEEARAQVDAQTRELINWHFSPETGCPYWLACVKHAGWDPREKV